MRVLLTGASGFLGWHTRARLHAGTGLEVVPVTRANWQSLTELVASTDAVIHVAGVNRGNATDVEKGNVRLAEHLASALRHVDGPRRVVYANSIQAGNDTQYGIGKEHAAALLGEATLHRGGSFVDVRLPNLFGEHGRSHYNSFVATFADAVVAGQVPAIQDRRIELLHAQDAAQALIDGLTTHDQRLEPIGRRVSVRGVYETLHGFFTLYCKGDLPAMNSKFDADLFNTLRASMFPNHYPIFPDMHDDERGRLVETVRVHGGQGQAFVSTTRPGYTRGDHFHLGKLERFVVVSGQARVRLRRLFHHDVVIFDVTGDTPSIIDMPTMWAHNITNTGDTDLTTLFWTNSVFDPREPDTFWEEVGPDEQEVAV